MLTILITLLVVVEVLCSLLLVGVILLQKTKGQGVGLAFGGAMGETLFGAHAGNVLTKATVILGVVFLVNTTLLAMLGVRRTSTSVTDRISVTPPAPAQPMQPMQPMRAAQPDVPTVTAGEGLPVAGTAPVVVPADVPDAPSTALPAPTVAPVTEAAPVPVEAPEAADAVPAPVE